MPSHTVQLTLTVPVEVKQEGNWFISSCTALDVHSQGVSEEHALHNLEEALQLFVETCLELGTLEQVLKECGFHHDMTPGLLPRQTRMIAIPIPLTRESVESAQECAC